MKTNANETVYCFSYQRYSSEGQRGNTSLKTQDDTLPEIATKNGWIIRSEWNVKQEAVSSYKKHNFPKLAAIADQARKGIIPQGTFCVVFAIDRLTRATLDEGREMLRQMLLAGINICDRENNQFTKADLNDLPKLMLLCLKIVAANEHCKRISDGVLKAHAVQRQQMKDGEKLLKTTKHALRMDIPYWLENDGTEFSVNEKAEIVNTVYKMYLSEIGPASIARRLNEQGISTLSEKGAWSQSVVFRLLDDRRVLGEREINIPRDEKSRRIGTGEWLKNYYPAIVTEDTFLRVQARRADNRGKPTTGKGEQNVTNIFSGVAYCTCGKLIKVNPGKRDNYIICHGRLRGLPCNQPTTKYQPFETACLSILRLHPSQLLRDENGNTGNVQKQILAGRLAETEKQIANITESLTVAVTKSLVLRQAELEQQAEEIKRQMELENAKTVAATGGMDRLVELLLSLRNIGTDQNVRRQVQAWIRENINRITVDTAKKEFTVDLKNGSVIEMDFNGTIKGTKSVTSIFAFSAEKEPVAASL